MTVRAYAVVARTPGGGIAAIEGSFRDAYRLVISTLERFRDGLLLTDAVPREPGALLDVYNNCFSARLAAPRVEIALSQPAFESTAPAPFREPYVLVVRGPRGIAETAITDGQNDLWDRAKRATEALQLGGDVEFFIAEDRRPAGGPVLPGFPEIVTAGQALDRVGDQLGAEAPTFEEEVGRLLALT